MRDQFCPACQMDVLYFGETQMDRCWNCGTQLVAPPTNGTSAVTRLTPPPPLGRLMAALFCAPLTSVGICLCYNLVTGIAPWIRMFRPAQFIGLGGLALFCAIYAGYLIGRGKSEWVQALNTYFVCILLIVNMTFVAVAAIYTR